MKDFMQRIKDEVTYMDEKGVRRFKPNQGNPKKPKPTGEWTCGGDDNQPNPTTGDVRHIKDCHLGENWKDCPACIENRQATTDQPKSTTGERTTGEWTCGGDDIQPKPATGLPDDMIVMQASEIAQLREQLDAEREKYDRAQEQIRFQQKQLAAEREEYKRSQEKVKEGK